jgi:hypothetical protein
MAEAISNTSPLFYLHQIGALDWLPRLFADVWITSAVIQELDAGRRQGCLVPEFGVHPWIRVDFRRHPPPHPRPGWRRLREESNHFATGQPFVPIAAMRAAQLQQGGLAKVRACEIVRWRVQGL